MAPPINPRRTIPTDIAIVAYEKLGTVFVGQRSPSYRLALIEGVGAGGEAVIGLAFGPSDLAAVVLAGQFFIIGALGSAVGEFFGVAYPDFFAVGRVADVGRVVVADGEGGEMGRCSIGHGGQG